MAAKVEAELGHVYVWDEKGNVVGRSTYYLRNGEIPEGKDHWGIQGAETVVEDRFSPPRLFPWTDIIEVVNSNGKDDTDNHAE